MNIMRTLQVEERPSRLALAIAEVGRIDKTIDTSNFIDAVVRGELRPLRTANES